jgi:hypothetical protein
VTVSSHCLLRPDPGNGAKRSDPAESKLQYVASFHCALPYFFKFARGTRSQPITSVALVLLSVVFVAE